MNQTYFEQLKNYQNRIERTATEKTMKCQNTRLQLTSTIASENEVLWSMTIIKLLFFLLSNAQIWLPQPGPIRTQRNQSAKAGRLIKNEPHAFW